MDYPQFSKVVRTDYQGWMCWWAVCIVNIVINSNLNNEQSKGLHSHDPVASPEKRITGTLQKQQQQQSEDPSYSQLTPTPTSISISFLPRFLAPLCSISRTYTNRSISSTCQKASFQRISINAETDPPSLKTASANLSGTVVLQYSFVVSIEEDDSEDKNWTLRQPV